MTKPFEASNCDYGLLYQQKDSAAEVAYVDCSLQRHGVAGKELKEFGCSTGRYGCLLAQCGYRVHGLTPSADLLHVYEEVVYADAGDQGIDKSSVMAGKKTTPFRVAKRPAKRRILPEASEGKLWI